MRQFLIAAAIALGAAVTPAAAGEVFTGSAALDKVEASYTRHNREHRMWEIQRTMEWQNRRGYRDRGYGYRDHGYGDYGRGYAYRRLHRGPPPWAPAYGRRYHDRYERF